MTRNILRKIIAASRWQVAESMPQIPHCYTLRKHAPSDGDFVAFVGFIRSHGYDEKFFSRSYRYLDIDGWQYWTMGSHVESTILINRAQLKRADRPIRLNPIRFSSTAWPEVYCKVTKKLIPRQTTPALSPDEKPE